MEKILFMGDSITDSGRIYEDEASMGMGYALMVTGELGLEHPGKYEFINKGINGHRIVDIYARMKRDILNLEPDVMSILVGVNDAWHKLLSSPNEVDAEKYFGIYSMLIEEIKEALPDIKIMILEPFVLKGSNTEENWDYMDKEVRLRAVMAKRIAEKFDLKFIPLQAKFDSLTKVMPDEYWLGDGVHPTPFGHAFIKNEWIKAFRTL